MSATNRGAKRHADDFYATPFWATDAVLPHLPLTGRILEPAAGTGAIVSRILARGVAPSRVTAYEIDPQRAATCAELGVTTAAKDFLVEPAGEADLIVTNPPYLLAKEFISESLTWVSDTGGTVAMLLRLNFLGSMRRAEFHRQHPCDVFVLPRRPSFTGGGTDATEYCWMIWSPTRGNRWQIIDLAETTSAASKATGTAMGLPKTRLIRAHTLEGGLDAKAADYE